MSNVQIVSFDPIRVLAEASISASYAAVGTALTEPVRIFAINNNTNGDMFFSIDGVNDHLFVPKNVSEVFDLNTNRTNQAQVWELAIGTQFYVRYSTMPSSGSVYITCMWGQ